MGCDAAGATLFRSTLPVLYAVVVPALRKVRKGRGTRSCGGFCSLKAGPPAIRIFRHSFRSFRCGLNFRIIRITAIRVFWQTDEVAEVNRR